MKIRLRELGRSLQDGLAGAYLVAGAEPLLVEEALDEIRAAARRQGFDSREVHVADRSFGWQALEAGADNLSLFAARRIVEIKLATPRPGEQAGKTIRALVEKADADRLLLVSVAERLDAAASAAAWVKAVERHGVWVEIWPVERRELPEWITRRARAHGLKIAADAALVLAERVEGNLLAADQELRKLALANPGEHELDEAAVLENVANSARYDVYGLADAVTAGDARRAFQVLGGLRAEGVEPVLLSWALCRELGLLARLKYALEQGAAVDALLARERVARRRHPNVKAALQRFGRRQLRELLVRAAEVDAAVKGIGAEPPWHALTGLVLASLEAGRLPARRRH